jgi:hypothetical protein
MTLAHDTDRIESERLIFRRMNRQISNSLLAFMQIQLLPDILEMEGPVLFRHPCIIRDVL